jgi:CheY-like chemotaxis protein
MQSRSALSLYVRAQVAHPAGMETDARGSGIFAISRTRRVLIVDDHVASAELIAEVLTAQGHEARIAHEPLGALQAALEFEPQVAILALGLPGMSGYELLTSLRAANELSECRFIALTGHAERADRRRSSEAGFQAHLTKPFDLRAVLLAVSVDTPAARPAAANR